MTWTTFITSVSAVFIIAMLIIAVMLNGCTHRSKIDDKMLEIDCKQCEVKYLRVKEKDIYELEKDID